jgi:hypothetical protein
VNLVRPNKPGLETTYASCIGRNLPLSFREYCTPRAPFTGVCPALLPNLNVTPTLNGEISLTAANRLQFSTGGLPLLNLERPSRCNSNLKIASGVVPADLIWNLQPTRTAGGILHMSFVNRKFSGLVVMLLVLAGFTPGLQAQTNYGSVRGLATDIQGGLISDAVVTLTNTGTKLVHTTKTNDSGEYDFSQVTPGDYVVEVSLKGFENFREAVTVELGRTATVDATLHVGSVDETIEVKAAEPLIDTASANAGQLFTSQQLTELPNLGRNPFVFEKLDNNVTPVGDPRYVRAEDQSGSSAVSIAGAPIGANSYVVDGIPTSTSSGGVTFIPSPEAVSDAKTQANTYDAEVGRTGGGVGNTSLKSGTATYHGVLYGETRQTNWSANSWLNKHTEYYINGADQNMTTPRPDVTTYLYAGALGGPVPFADKLSYLKNTFFFTTEEGYRQAQPLTGTGRLTVPTPHEAMGDFSGDPITLYDPTSPFLFGKRTAVLTGMLNGTPTANVIPASYMNPIGTWIAQNAYPSQTNVASSYGSFNSQRSDDFKTRSDMYSGKLDHTFFSWWSANASYVHLATQEPSGDFYGNKGNFSSDGRLVRFNDATSFYNVFTINPTTIATVGYGFNRYYSVSFPYGLGFNLATGFGGSGFPAGFLASDQSKSGSQYSFPGITVTQGSAASYAALGGGFNGRSIPSATHNFVLGLQKTIGKQSLKGGYVYRAMHVASDPLGSNPAFNFGGNYTSVDGKASSSSGTGNGLADLEMGLVGGTISSSSPYSATIGQSTGSFNERASYHALFFQDDIRMTENLTVTMGLRYEYELGLREANNQLTVGFDSSTTYADPVTNTVMHGGLAYAGKNGYPVHTANQSHTKLSPRIGVAYQIRRDTVLQAGFGVFYAPEAVSPFNAGYSQTSTYSPGTGGNVTAPTAVSAIGSGAYLSNPFSTAGSIIPPSANTLGNLTALGSTISVVDFNRKDPLVEQYSARVEHQLPWATTLTVGYVGAHAKNFPLAVNINQLPDATMAQLAANPVDMSAKVINPYYYPTVTNGSTTYGTASITSNSTVQSGQLLLPFPQFSTITLSESVGYSLYNALNVKVQKQAAKGLTVLFTYTWASNWDNLYNGGSSLNGTNGPADNYNLKKEYARSSNDMPNRFAAGVTYALPFGRGQEFFSGMPKAVDYLLGGYHIDAIVTREDGSPIGITQGTSLSNTFGVTGFGGQVRPNLTGVSPCFSGTPEQKVNHNGFYFNPAAFSGTQAFAYGNAPRSISCKGPGLSDTDLNITKDIAITEGVKIRFMVEALNITNTPEFSLSGQSLTTTSNGVGAAPGVKGTPGTTGILSQNNYNRIIQMGGRIFF